MSDYYQVLGVAPTASAAEIRQAYARLAREKHPDRFTDPAEKQRAQTAFQDITTAFNTLVNPRSRAGVRRRSATSPCSAPPRRSRRDAFERAQPLLEGGGLEEAVTLLRTAVHHAPDQAAYHAALGRALAPRPRARAGRGPGPRARDPARAAERRRPSRTSRPCSRGRACGCARRRRWRRRSASPPATRGSRASPPSWGWARRERHEDHLRGAQRRRPQAEGQRGRALPQSRPEALRRGGRHGRPRRGRGRLPRRGGRHQRVRDPHRRQRGDHLAVRPRRLDLLRGQPAEDRDPPRQPAGPGGHPGERGVRGHGDHRGRGAGGRRPPRTSPTWATAASTCGAAARSPSSPATTPG